MAWHQDDQHDQGAIQVAKPLLIGTSVDSALRTLLTLGVGALKLKEIDEAFAEPLSLAFPAFRLEE